jgi:hypothetical protein
MSLFVATPSAQAATITVTADALDVLNGVDASCSLREAITNINNGADTYADCANTGAAYGTSDTINIPAGTYTHAIAGTGEDFNATGDYDLRASVVINGAGAGTTFIDGAAADRVFHIPSSSVGNVNGVANITVTVSNMTVRNGKLTVAGWEGVGAGFWLTGVNNTLAITNVTVTGNLLTGANGGAGIGAYSRTTANTLTVTNSTVSNNNIAAGNYGAGINVNLGNVSISGSTFSGNTGTNAAAAYLANLASLSIADSTFTGNTGTGLGGAMYLNTPPAGSTISNSRIIGNTTGAGTGGGLYLKNGTLTISGTEVSGNTAGTGGGVYVNGTALTIENSTIASATNGGGLYNIAGTTNLNFVTVAGNTGGNVTRAGGTVSVKNSIIADPATGANCTGVVTDAGTNFEAHVGATYTCPGTFTRNTASGLSALANNGGSTQTMALAGASAARNIANTATLLGTDQRGTARAAAPHDAGAFESPYLDVTVTVVGVGSVADNGALGGFTISCPGTCADFVNNGDSVILNATPGAGNVVTWSGACAGAGTCALSNIAADKNVTATFAAPIPGAPIVTTGGSASGVSQTSATLHGTVNPDNGGATTVTFNYGTTNAYGTSVTAAQSPLADGGSSSAVTADVTGLGCGTTYHYRVTGVNGSGTGNGADATFTTTTCPAPTTPDLGGSVTSVNFGNVTVGESGSGTATVSNSGNGSVAVTGVGSPNFPFANADDGCSGQALAPSGASCAIGFTFTPTAAGTFGESVTVSTNYGPLTLTLTGVGVASGGNGGGLTPPTLLTPDDGATLPAGSVTFAWEPGAGEDRFFICANETFEGCGQTAQLDLPLGMVVVGILIPFGLRSRAGRSALLALLIVAGGVTACGPSSDTTTDTTPVTQAATLTAGTYYWKVMTTDGDATGESEVRSLTVR